MQLQSGRAALSILLRVPSKRTSLASVRLALVTLIVLSIIAICLRGSTSNRLTASLARVASIGITQASVGSLAGTTLLLGLARCLTFGPKVWCWARDIFRGIIGVELLVNRLWNGGDFSTKLLLDLVKVEAIIPIDQVDRHS